ncbi:hypothetical protein J2X69_000717 [Algoriphagus sp. 4150]|nr:hypothetical protein [Algoriphagus sp. 4150]
MIFSKRFERAFHAADSIKKQLATQESKEHRIEVFCASTVTIDSTKKAVRTLP